MQRLRRTLAGLLAVLLAAPAAYLLAALALGLLPVNPQWRSVPHADGAVLVWLRTNGVHADLVLPARSPHDFTQEFAPDVVIDRARAPAPEAFEWIAFGWGDREFFIRTRTWRDLRPATAASALLGLGPAAMHVEYLARPQDYRAQRIDLSAGQYLRLVEGLRGGFARDGVGRPRRIDEPGYFDTDAFYEATGRYTLRLTCNEWIRRLLAGAGVRTAAWSPFEAALFWHLR